MEHTATDIETDISLLPSFLKVFAVFQMCLLYHENKEYVVESIYIKCNHCHINNGLHSRDKAVEEIITPFDLLQPKMSTFLHALSF